MTAKDYIDNKSIHVDRSSIFELKFGEYIEDDFIYIHEFEVITK